jgi:quercetin dioxygenase-like cupin family protein
MKEASDTEALVNRRTLLKLGVPALYLAACKPREEAAAWGGLTAAAASDLADIDSDGRPLVVLPEEGLMTTGEMVIKVPSSAMSGHFSIMHGQLDGLQLLPPHTHAHEDQIVYVLAGVLDFEFDGNGEVIRAPAGSYVIKPRTVQHAFWNPGEDTVAYVELSTEDGFEGYVRDVEGPESLPELEATYGVIHDIADTVRLVKEHGLTSIHRVSPQEFSLLMAMYG